MGGDVLLAGVGQLQQVQRLLAVVAQQVGGVLNQIALGRAPVGRLDPGDQAVAQAVGCGLGCVQPGLRRLPAASAQVGQVVQPGLDARGLLAARLGQLGGSRRLQRVQRPIVAAGQQRGHAQAVGDAHKGQELALNFGQGFHLFPQFLELLAQASQGGEQLAALGQEGAAPFVGLSREAPVQLGLRLVAQQLVRRLGDQR